MKNIFLLIYLLTYFLVSNAPVLSESINHCDGIIVEKEELKYINLGYEKEPSDRELGISDDLPESVKIYYRKMFKQIRESAKIPDLGVKGVVKVSFSASKEGSVSDVKLVSSSGNQEVDQAALSSILYAAPFSEMPVELNYSSIIVNYTFFLGSSDGQIENNSYELEYVPGKNNPIKYKYQKSYGHYLDSTISQLKANDISFFDHRFEHFPLRYYVNISSELDKDLVKSCFNDFSKYINIVEGEKLSLASITVEIDPKLKKRLGYAKTKNDSNGFRSNIYLNTKLFEYPYSIQARYIIKHEILHSLGILGHSNNPKDVLSTGLNICCDYGKHECLVKETGEIKTAEEFGTITERDLNTLWLLYNQ